MVPRRDTVTNRQTQAGTAILGGQERSAKFFDYCRVQARALQDVCAAAGVPLIINDDAALAAAVGAAGVHLGEDDGDIAAARALLGPGALIGASCYDQLELARRAVAAAFPRSR